MAHERIVSTEPAASLIISWDDESGTVSLGMEWDDPRAANPAEPGTGEANTEPADGPREDAGVTGDGVTGDGVTGDGVTGHRVEYSLGGRVEIPVENYELRPYYNEAEQRWSIYLRMDRPRLNRIITTVRRARNKAFGADE